MPMAPPKTRANPRLTAAIWYAATFRWSVLPCHSVREGQCSCRDRECTGPGKHPRTRHGFYDATTDPEQLQTWWQRWPDANVGVRTGRESGLAVLDIDPERGGEETLAELIAVHRPLPETVESLTGGGGRHIYFAYPPDPPGTWPRELGPGIDLKADGGYIVVPPSTHLTGRQYEWAVSSRLKVVCVAPLPPWVLELLAGPSTKTTVPSTSAPIPEGRRNDVLTSLAGSMQRRNMSEASIVAALLMENEKRCDPPLPEREVRGIAASIGRYSPAAPSTNGHYPALVDDDLHNSDTGNGKRLVLLHGFDLRYCAPWKSWFVWEGNRWAPDRTGEIYRRAKGTVAAMYAQAGQIDDEQTRTRLARYALASEARQRVEAMIEMAKTEPGIPITPEEFDADPCALNCENGILDLRTGELTPHRRDALCTMMTAAAYDPTAQLQEWDDFIANVTNGDPAVAQFLQTAAGASLSGELVERFFFVYGRKLTGKTTFVSALGNALGSYAMTADFESFLHRERPGAPRPDLARLRGARFVKSVEVGEGRRWAEGLLKQLTGGDTVTARFLFGREFEYVPQFTLWIVANDAPEVSSDDDAFWRRLLRVPFDHEFISPDETIKQRLLNSDLAGPAILRWAVQGCLEWQRFGIEVPEVVSRSTADYRSGSDPLRDFLDEQCVVGPDFHVRAKALYQAYRSHADESGIRPRDMLSNTKFGLLLSRRFRRERDGRGNTYLGIGIRGDETQADLGGL